MPEADDVLLHAAEAAWSAARARWRPDGDEAGAGPGRDGAGRRRATLLVRACLGREWPVVEVDAPPPPGRLKRWFGRLAPWEEAPSATSGHDGARILLPRAGWPGAGLPGAPPPGDALSGAAQGPSAAAPPRGHGPSPALVALGQAARLVRAGPWVAEPRLRDVAWLAEGAAVDAWLAREWPGLTAELERTRALARALRPEDAHLAPAERAVEAAARRLLEPPLPDLARALAHELDLDLEDPLGPARWAAAWLARHDAEAPAVPRPGGARGWAAWWAAGARAYRGVAPVPHWGRPRAPIGPAPATGGGGGPDAGRGRRPRAQRLARHVEAAAPTPEDERPGPFVVHGDPQLAVQDPGGVSRPRDHGEDEDDLDALADELGRLGELPRVRAPGTPPEVVTADEEVARDAARAPAAPDGARGPGAALAETFRYPEWDARRGVYRPAWVTVREGPPDGQAAGWGQAVLARRRALVRDLRRRFEALRPRRERRPRQHDGEELDVDAWVERAADLRARVTPCDRLWVAERPRRRDVAVALLIDASGSTDGHVARGLRVIDVAREAALCFAEALDAARDRHAIWAFTGRGPGDVRLLRLKAPQERLSDAVRDRIGALAPGAYTRLGAALRHVTWRLEAEPARHRLLVVLSDGRPNDEDEYEGDHGVEDVRRAVAEARERGVHPFCVTIDRCGPGYLPRMLGPGGFAVLHDVARLPEHLTEVYRRLTTR